MSGEPWASRAATVAKQITDAYGHRLAGLPGTWIGRVALPSTRPRPPWVHWNYWWQAHFVDCLVDAARREWHLASKPPSAPPQWLRLAQRMIRTVRLRNFGRFENPFFDDMAWLALAASRAERLSREISAQGLPPAAHAAEVLGRRLASGDTLDLGGGMFWNTKRHYKNTAATGPAALFFAHSDAPRDRIRAQALVDWLFENLLDPSSGLFLDGIDLRRDKSGYLTTTVNHDIWTYNQGPVLGALLELGTGAGGPGPGIGSPVGDGSGGGAGSGGGPNASGQPEGAPSDEAVREPQASNLARAERLIEAIASGLVDGEALRSDGEGGDHGLFRGILVRYLALAAVDPQLSASARKTAKRLVLATAEGVWAGEASASEVPAPGPSGAGTAGLDAAAAATGTGATGPESQLSSRLQAWMVLEAAAVVAAAPDIAPDAA